MTAAENERLARLETEIAHIRKEQADVKKKLDAMYEAFLQARGAKWVVVSLWIGLGAAVANMKLILEAVGVRFN